ncbi:MAG: metal ABC transporter substrate-binding protein [Anaerorhabdus sp.]|uniref:metal ABC transporter substrate-binding protein n=1 Tax=Anaerorhabdus sp. TaxID=1872524 RepID=UPI003A8AA334
MKKKLILSLILVLMLTALTGCDVKKMQVAYTVYPVGYLANRLVGDKLQVVSVQNDEIVQRATLVDNYLDILDLSQTLFHIGSLEPYLSVNSKEIKDSKVKTNDLSVLNAIYKFQRYTPINVDGSITYIESAYYKGEPFANVDSYEKDLYLWMDPIAMLSMAKDIEKWLSSTYSENSSVFKENLEALEKDLVQLDAEYQKLATKLINENKEIKFVSMTPSFGNWQKAYGIQVYPIVLSKYGGLPTDEQLKIIKDRIIADNVQYIVYEPNLPEDMVQMLETLEKDLGLKRVTMSNLSSLTTSQQEENKDYISIMYENLATLESMATDIPVAVQSKITATEGQPEEQMNQAHDDLN